MPDLSPNQNALEFNPQASSKAAATAAILVIGNEILSGRTADQNIHFLAMELGKLGIILSEVRVVPDIAARIVAAVNALRMEYDCVFTTGGIGPTHDDITAESMAIAFGAALHENAEACARLEKYYGAENLTAPRRRMAQMPVGALLIENPVSGAPGFQMENVYVLAGVPKIMQAMFGALSARLPGGTPRHCITVDCQVPESVLADGLRSIAEEFKDLDIGSYPYFRPQTIEKANGMPGIGSLGVSLVVRGLPVAAVEAAAEKIIQLIRTCGGTPVIQ